MLKNKKDNIILFPVPKKESILDFKNTYAKQSVYWRISIYSNEVEVVKTDNIKGE